MVESNNCFCKTFQSFSPFNYLYKSNLKKVKQQVIEDHSLFSFNCEENDVEEMCVSLLLFSILF